MTTNLSSDAVEYDYDSYGCNGTCYDYDLCFDSTYEGLRVTEVDVYAVLREVLNVLPSVVLPVQLFDLAEQLKLAEPESYYVYGSPSYYGEEVHVEFEDSDVESQLRQLYAELQA